MFARPVSRTTGHDAVGGRDVLEDNPPSDGTTLSAVLEEMETAGYGGQFSSAPGGQIRCSVCHHLAPAEVVTAERWRRLEGASDPDDMLVVVGLICPECGHRGTLVLTYGPETTSDDSEVLTRLPLQADAARRAT
jgi:hypothetical protein